MERAELKSGRKIEDGERRYIGNMDQKQFN